MTFCCILEFWTHTSRMVPCERLLEAAGKDDNAEAEGRSNGSTAFAMSGGHANNAVDGRGLVFVFLAS